MDETWSCIDLQVNKKGVLSPNLDDEYLQYVVFITGLHESLSEELLYPDDLVRLVRR